MKEALSSTKWTYDKNTSSYLLKQGKAVWEINLEDGTYYISLFLDGDLDSDPIGDEAYSKSEIVTVLKDMADEEGIDPPTVAFKK